MKPRELGGAIGRANAIFVWVPYTEVVYEDDEDESVEVLEEAPTPNPDDEIDEDPEEGSEEGEEIGVWLAITKVQARELVADACTSEIEGLDILAEERPAGLYIGLGPLP
jgi:hypothetical protein